MFSSSAISRLIHESEERNIVTWTTILAQTAWRSQRSYIFTQQPRAKCNFQSQILFLFITYQMLNQVNCVNFTFLFVYSFFFFFFFLWLSFGTERLCKIWGLSNFQRSAILTSFGNTSLTTRSGPAAPARERQHGEGSDAFLEVIYAMQNKWRAVAGLLSAAFEWKCSGLTALLRSFFTSAKRAVLDMTTRHELNISTPQVPCSVSHWPWKPLSEVWLRMMTGNADPSFLFILE